MDFQTIVTNAVAKARNEELKSLPVLSLGELIAKLEAVSPTWERHDGKIKPKEVRFDFCGTFPTSLHSWRGVYAELALGYATGDEYTNDGEPRYDPPSAEKLLAELREAVGKTFQGYKGGDYVMGRQTPVWCDNYGDAWNTAIVDVKDTGYYVILVTQHIDEGM